MARRTSIAAGRQRASKLLREHLRMIQTMALTQRSLVNSSTAPVCARYLAWINAPHPGDLVVEVSAVQRKPGSTDGIGRLVSITYTAGDKAYEIELIDKPKHRVTWTNAAFTRPVCTEEQRAMIHFGAVYDAPLARSMCIPWCSLDRDVRYEVVGRSDGGWETHYRCRGCGYTTTRKRYADVELCPTCHVPDPPRRECVYCAASPET